MHNDVVDVTDRIAVMGGGYSARPRRIMPVVAAAGGKPASANPVTTVVEPPPIPDQASQSSDSAAAAGTESTDTGPGSFEELHRKCKGVASSRDIVVIMSYLPYQTSITAGYCLDRNNCVLMVTVIKVIDAERLPYWSTNLGKI